MNTKPLARKNRRSPGEIALDQCFLPLVTFVVLLVTFVVFSLAFNFIAWGISPPYRELMETRLAEGLLGTGWDGGISLVAGLCLALLWLRAVVTLIGVWRDPSSRILRFSASALLILSAGVIYNLLFYSFK